VSNFSIENIGALELNSASALLSDGLLETSAASMVSPTLTNQCNATRVCGRIDDGELEAMAMNPGAPTKPGWTGACCGRIDDAAN
jgi:hypothetical protein